MYTFVARLTQKPARLARVRRWGRWVPRSLVVGGCWLLAMGGMLFVPNLRRQVSANIQIGTASPDGSLRLAIAHIAHLLLTFYEIVVDVAHLDERKIAWFRWSGVNHVEAALAQGRGVILFAPHLGNFFFAYWCLCQRFNCLTVGTASSPELRPLYETFYALGCGGLDYDATPPREMVRTLRRHLAQNGVVLLLGDFWRSSFPAATLLDQVSRSPQGAAVFALDDGVPIVPFYAVRSGRQHNLVFAPALDLRCRFARHERRAATDALNVWLTSIIRQYPAQWFYWFNVHERWAARPITGGSEQMAVG